MFGNLQISRCEGEDLNLHGSYPASTSRYRYCGKHDVFTRVERLETPQNTATRFQTWGSFLGVIAS